MDPDSVVRIVRNPRVPEFIENSPKIVDTNEIPESRFFLSRYLHHGRIPGSNPSFFMPLLCLQLLGCPCYRNFATWLDAIPQIEVYQILIRYSSVFWHPFEIFDDVDTHSNGYLFLQLFRIRIFTSFHVWKIVFFPHNFSRRDSMLYTMGVMVWFYGKGSWIKRWLYSQYGLQSDIQEYIWIRKRSG